MNFVNIFVCFMNFALRCFSLPVYNVTLCKTKMQHYGNILEKNSIQMNREQRQTIWQNDAK